VDHRISSAAADVDILRAFEPVVHYTHGEKFFPMDVEPYVRASSLWLHVPEGTDEEVVPEGQLTLGRLVERREAPFGSLFYLRFVHPLDLTESASALAGERRLEREQGSEFKAGLGRLARGGLLPRLGDGLFSLSLLLRGTVPGATAAAAALKYDEIRKSDGRFVYQGRVVRQSGWTVCQYWFFFAYNPWRSGFHGVNDHESDWEMISVYLYEDDQELVPAWVAYASHDFHGADLRRRWDDRVDLELVDGHPVVYAGAGSHAAYFRPGEYQAEVPIPAPRRIKRLAEALDGFWRIRLGQGDETRRPLRIPFVDFARGDGLSIGPRQEHEWTPNVIDEATPWAAEYRGLWGLFARDPISGENAPAGPMYDRDGSGRPSWFDPLGFAGLAQVTPPPQELAVMEKELRSLEARQAEIEGLVAAETTVIRELGVRLDSMRGSPHLATESARIDEQATAQTERLTALRRERSENDAVIEGLERSIERSKAGDAEDGRAHIRHAAAPVPAATMRFNHAAEIWAAISISALLIGLAVLILASPSNVWAELIVLVIAFVIGESVLRGTFVRTINQIGVMLALIATVVLFIEYLKYAVVVLLIALAAFLLYQRVRELRA
jgi:hypothetical protein